MHLKNNIVSYVIEKRFQNREIRQHGSLMKYSQHFTAFYSCPMDLFSILLDLIVLKLAKIVCKFVIVDHMPQSPIQFL